MKTVSLKLLKNFKGDFPKYETDFSSGLDVRAQLEKDQVLKFGERALIPTGLSFEIPQGFEIQVRPRSGLAFKQGVTVLNSPGTIDADYRGELKILLIHLGQEDFIIKDQDRIAQIVLAPVTRLQWNLVESLSSSQRGDGGFGSTGVRKHSV